MPIAHTPVEFGFNGHDRRRLAKALKRTEKASVYRRLQAVLLVASGYAVNQVAQLTGALRRAVYQWVKYYLATHRVDSLAERPRYIIEDIPNPTTPPAGESATDAWKRGATGNEYYRITSRGVGSTPQSQSMVQIIFRK